MIVKMTSDWLRHAQISPLLDDAIFPGDLVKFWSMHVRPTKSKYVLGLVLGMMNENTELKEYPSGTVEVAYVLVV